MSRKNEPQNKFHDVTIICLIFVLGTLLPWNFFITAIPMLSSGSSVYVRRGSDITDCSMKCPDRKSAYQLYQKCGNEEEKHLLDLRCEDMLPSNSSEPRFSYNTSSGCWTLTDARKDDSCLYVLWRHSRLGSFRHSTTITVLDPVLISNITSNSSRLGQDIAVSVQFSGEEVLVTWEVDGGSLPNRYRLIDDNRVLIILSAEREDAGRRLSVRIANPVSEEIWEYQLEITDASSSLLPVAVVVGIYLLLAISIIVLVQCWKTTKRVEKNTNPEEDGEASRSSSDSSGEHGEEKKKRRTSSSIIHCIWRRGWKNSEYE